MAVIISKDVEQGFIYEAAKIAVTSGRRVEEVYEQLLENYRIASEYVERKQEEARNNLFLR